MPRVMGFLPEGRRNSGGRRGWTLGEFGEGSMQQGIWNLLEGTAPPPQKKKIDNPHLSLMEPRLSEIIFYTVYDDNFQHRYEASDTYYN